MVVCRVRSVFMLIKCLLAVCFHEAWVEITNVAFNVTSICKPVVLVDQAEILVSVGTGLFSTVLRGEVSMFTKLCSHIPQGHASVWFGTLSASLNAPAEQYTRFYLTSVRALMPLTYASVEEMMTQWQGKIYHPARLKQIVACSGGVPRLLEYVFNDKGTVATVYAAINAMSQCFNQSYKDVVTRYLRDDDVAWKLVLCAAVGWPASPLDTVPGSALKWGTLFHEGAAFPVSDSIVIPWIWWHNDTDVYGRIGSQLRQMGLDLESMHPNPLDMVESAQGAVKTGKPWEKMFANCLAARFRLICISKNMDATTTWLPLRDVYLTQNQHVAEVLRPFEVSWGAGVQSPDTETFVDSHIQANVITLNAKVADAHHDILLPARRVGTKTPEYIAVQCRFGQPKNATELQKSEQHKVRKGGEEMSNVLLQCASNAKEGRRQRFQLSEAAKPKAKPKPKGRPKKGSESSVEGQPEAVVQGEGSETKKKAGDLWFALQDKKQYALISGANLCAQLEMLKLLAGQ
eukprot:6159132-Amphidinium_carterae.1